MAKPAIILFDGICVFCDGMVQFIMSRDRAQHFVFATLQGDTGKKLQQQYQFSTDSFVFIEDGIAYNKSTAALKVFQKLPIPYKLLYIFIVVPRSWRDWMYNFIAKRRYQIFGKKGACSLPSTEDQKRFLP
jgi:predicted DCC family thiol-disulfide oxidoreductase YuxK